MRIETQLTAGTSLQLAPIHFETSNAINPVIIIVILNPSPVTLSETKGLAVQLRTGSVKDLATA
jgi:hypothetical protein